MAAPLTYNMVYGPEPVTGGARVQLVVGQTINGMGLGLALAGLAGSERIPIYTAMALLGSGTGAAIALLASRDGVTPGQAAVINNGTVFGGLAAGMMLLGLSDRGISSRTVFGLLAGGLALGTGAGVVLAAQRPLSGRVEFASSMGLWSTFLGAHLYLGSRGYGSWDRYGDTEVPVLGWSSLGFLAAGLTAGILLAPSVPVSAARMRWINLAAAGGWAVIGFSSFLLATGGTGNDMLMAYSIGSIVGVAGGAALGYFLTQDTDTYWERMHDGITGRRGPTIGFAPGADGSSLGASLVGSF
jgi:hypothetical protein